MSVGDNCNLHGCQIRDSIIMADCIIRSKIDLSNSIIAHGSEIDESDIPNKHQFLLGERSQLKI